MLKTIEKFLKIMGKKRRTEDETKKNKFLVCHGYRFLYNNVNRLFMDEIVCKMIVNFWIIKQLKNEPKKIIQTGHSYRKFKSIKQFVFDFNVSTIQWEKEVENKILLYIIRDTGMNKDLLGGFVVSGKTLFLFLFILNGYSGSNKLVE